MKVLIGAIDKYQLIDARWVLQCAAYSVLISVFTDCVFKMTVLRNSDLKKSNLWNHELIKRYDLSGPRYTSYPTAPQFHEQFTEQAFLAAIGRGNQSGRPLSLYFHIPFCSTVCYYCACNKVITANRKRALPYLKSLITEIERVGAYADRNRSVDQLHWGGGTPTYIRDDEKRLLMEAIGRHFNLRSDDSGEYSIEIHPGETSVESIGCLRDLGFNRLSIGIQDFDETVQQAVNRFNSVAEVRSLVDAAHAQGFHAISMDLIYGLPHQSWETFERTLDDIILLSPDRLSVFNYAHLPHMFKVQRQINEQHLPPPEVKLNILEKATEKLLDAGYVYIGMDHFAKPDDELAVAQQQGRLQRNFQGYATHGGCDLIGMGVSSISAIDNVFSQNHKTLDEYTQAIDQGRLPVVRGIELSRDDLLRRQVIQQLTCQFKLEFSDIEQQFDILFADYFGEELSALQPMIEDGLLLRTEHSIQVTEAGRLFIRRICMLFDVYLRESAQPVKFSKIL